MKSVPVGVRHREITFADPVELPVAASLRAAITSGDIAVGDQLLLRWVGLHRR
ncbi:hypothetical protein [Actinopolymorpha rutila]|nr:hypothetical protein [Actinopolymorpha rutila]